jgi:predicted amidohydrolase YtcJ
VQVSTHSDTPVSPIDPLFSAWCAANRLTSSGRLLGANERVSVLDALKLVTINAAYVLHQDHELGSIQVGKRADFTVLGADPLAVAPIDLKDVPVLGTVLGGRPVVL